MFYAICFAIFSEIARINSFKTTDWLFPVSESFFTSFSVKDKSKDNTHLFDYGLSAGCGLKLPLGRGIYFTTDLLINMGLRKIDRKNNNEYQISDVPASSGYNHVIISGNYFGLSSKAKNINTALTVGLSIEL